MYAVGKLSSYITQGVYTVSGPFHPFGGAVDMVVVQQQDGSLKSSPWYVKFGKFQGVLKAKERVVDINVNGVDADFHMYLDPRGEAYFLREVDSEEEVVDTASSPSSLCEDIDGNGKHPVKSKSMNYDFDHSSSVDVTDGKVLTRTNSKRSRILGFVLGRRSMNEHILSKEENDANHGRTASLEGEIAADLLEMKWSTNFSSRSNMKDCKASRKDNGEIIGGRLEGSLVLHEQHFVNKLESFKEVDETIVADIVHGVDKDFQNEHNGSVENCVPEEGSRTQLGYPNEAEMGLRKAEGPIKIVTERCTEVASNQEGDTSVVVSCSTVAVDESNEIRPLLEPYVEFQDVSSDSVVIKQISQRIVEEQVIDDLNESRPSLEFHDVSADSVIIKQISEQVVAEQFIDESNEIRQRLESNGEFHDVLGDSVVIKHVSERVVEEQFIDESNELRPSFESHGEFQDVASDSVVIKQVSEQVVEEQLIFSDLDDSKPSIKNTELEVNPPPIKLHEEPLKVEIKGVKGNLKRCRSNVDIPSIREVTKEGVGRRAKSLPNMWSHFDDLVSDNHEDSQFYSPVAKFRPSNWDLVREDASRIIKANLEKELPQNADPLSKDLKDGSISSGSSDSAGGSWSLWPFRRLGSRNVSPKEHNSKKDSDVDIVPDADGEKEACSPSSNKHKRALTPTPEQLASLNLAEGRNIVTFTFSTSVLGPQKVDARIYLWRWDTRIVISDVDGTITKSDVLGQFMPLVGRDWSHIGVTHLFSGIKENGYQMLYLSARAISQASITRQFLFNLKQDGKALPDGPVVISPDGLFPSLFREVIRRAPHEFKIACLEDIKACFPSDRNPFYAGFGNRDTDEYSYLKVGIAKGKIFIINPKGEVVVNRCIDSKSYASLHALVHGIFPPISVHEEEDYNSWNFWKLPPPIME